jgi:Domain of unknown function (DUF1707)
MPTEYHQSRTSQYWPRGFSPLFSGPYSDQHLRVSDAERQAVTDRLAEHFGDGRLDQAEFDERIGRAMSAKTRADLGGLFDDLPETGDQVAPEPPRYRRRRGHPVLILALFFVLALTVGHALFWAVVPLVWLGLLVAVVMLATRTVGHTRARQDR